MNQKDKIPYVCKKIDKNLVIDGDLTKDVWANAARSPRFIDAIGGTPGIYGTQAALLWNDEYLYVAFWCEDPYPIATIQQRDAYLWQESDIEVFIDGGDSYYEFQMNALGTLYEVLYLWQDAYWNSPELQAQFDLKSPYMRVFGGNHDRLGDSFWKGTHPRGNRYAFLNWDMEGVQVATQVDGVLNDRTTVSRGWTAEIAFPWKSMELLRGGRSLPPRNGDLWKLFFGRYQNLEIGGKVIPAGWSWDIIGTDDNHYPEKFTHIRFEE